jgi:outer membrane protein assembly factor BamD (BamD/ComL family)
MQRENFYILLELSIDPAEENPDVIETAIKKKQAEWSRNRNHPTKGLQAKQYIGLIPEIRRIMFDPALRIQESQEARKQAEKKEAEKFTEIDRHLQLRMSKGFITDEEIIKLAKLHGIDERIIRTRAARMEIQKLAEIDKHLSIRLAKGYITEEEISKLAKLHGLPDAKIRSRVKGPIRKTAKESSEPVEVLDKSLQKSINDNLGIIKKSSLYHFLDVSPTADLEALQHATREKESELAKVGKKDASITAGSILVGHCMTLFKSDESRNAYDISRAQAQLAKLHSDIDVAGLDGRIRSEYFDPLVRNAMQFGMDREEAAQYIQEYCKKKGWRVDSVPAAASAAAAQPAARFPLVPIIATAAVVLVVMAGAIWWYFFAGSARNDYNRVMTALEGESNLERRIVLLKQFVQQHPQGEYSTRAVMQLQGLQRTVADQQVRQLLTRIDALRGQGQLEEALRLLEERQTHVSGPQQEKLLQQLKALKTDIEARDYDTLLEASRTLKPERIELYLAYLRRYPEGTQRAAVQKLLAEMAEETYLAFRKESAALTAAGNWEQAILLAERFLTAYPDNKRSSEVREALASFQKGLTDKKQFDNLMVLADSKGEDHAAAISVLREFLNAYPKTAIRDQVRADLQRRETIARQARVGEALKVAAARLAAAGGARFSIKTTGVVSDSRTNLSWTLLNSSEELNACLDYEGAERYVKELKTGGFSDWRLPTPDELAALYSKEPALADPPGNWYWSNRHYSHFADKMSIKMVDVLSGAGGAWRNEKKDSRDCGTVRAVRP